MALMELKSYDLKKELMVLSSKELLEGKLVLTKEIEEKEAFVYSLPDPKNKKEYLEQSIHGSRTADRERELPKDSVPERIRIKSLLMSVCSQADRDMR